MILKQKQSSREFVDTFDLYLLLIDGKIETFKADLHKLVKSERCDSGVFDIWINQDFEYSNLIAKFEQIMSQYEINLPLSGREMREIREGVAFWKYLNGEILGIDLFEYCWFNVIDIREKEPINNLWYDIDQELDYINDPAENERIIKEKIAAFMKVYEKGSADIG